jgi:hypothetical protein
MTTTNHVPTIKQWDTNPDRESLRVIHRFLTRREAIENVSLEPRRTHPHLVRATVSDLVSSIVPGVLEVRWYETRDFVITYQTDRANDDSPLLRWIYPPDAEEIKVSHSGSDNVQTLTLSSHHLVENHFHPLRVLPLVLATIEEYTK